MCVCVCVCACVCVCVGVCVWVGVGVCRLGYFRGGFIFSQLAQNVTARN